MNPRAHIPGDARAMPAHTRGLWAEACGWVAWLLGRFDRTALRTTGISRENGVRLSTWLMNIESAVRRIIIIAALALAPSRQLRICRPRICTAERATVTPRRPGFRVFRLNNAGGAPRSLMHANAQATDGQAARPYGHVAFKADKLLSLGAAPPSRQGQTPHAATAHAPAQALGTRARNPLDRWVRPCRQDPDWRPPETRDTADRVMRDATTAAGRRVAAPPEPKPPQAVPEGACDGLHPSLFDWRRRYDAWTQPVPAPDLAARLEALAHVISNPAAIIANAARRLHGPAAAAPPLIRNASPDTRPPRRAAHIETLNDASDLARRCHAPLAPDSS